MTLQIDDPRRWRPLPSDAEVRIVSPTPLGSRYLMDYPIGRGATGQVWRGRRRGDGSPVAIKVLHEEFASEPDVVTRFVRERSTLKGLSHPHLVPVYDLVAEGDTVAVVMEFVDGEDLRRVAAVDGPDRCRAPDQHWGLDLHEVLTVLTQVADALAYIHTAGVVHRDVKPENIMVTRRAGRVFARLTDFGVAWIVDGQSPTAGSHVAGTPAYLAPELLASRPYGPTVDVYALGVTAHELISGRRPFEADNPLALMRAHLDEEPTRPDCMPGDVWELVRSCLAKQPHNRPMAAQISTHVEALRLALAVRGSVWRRARVG